MDPDQDGTPRSVEPRRPDVEREAVFARRHAGSAQPAIDGLHQARGDGGRFQDATVEQDGGGFDEVAVALTQ